MRFWLGLALRSFLEILITFSLKIVEFLAWAGPEQFLALSSFLDIPITF